MSNYRIRKEFNPFNLRSEEQGKKKRIKFERLPSRIKTKPIWWFIIVFVFVIIIYWYLNLKVS